MVSRVALRASELDVGDFLGKIEIGEIDQRTQHITARAPLEAARLEPVACGGQRGLSQQPKPDRSPVDGGVRRQSKLAIDFYVAVGTWLG